MPYNASKAGMHLPVILTILQYDALRCYSGEAYGCYLGR